MSAAPSPTLAQRIRSAVRRLRHEMHAKRIEEFRSVCIAIAQAIPQPVFVKVGANDGVTGDPCSDLLLAQGKWKGLLIEPVPDCFARLRTNFSDTERFALEQVAVGESPGMSTFYSVDPAARCAFADLPYFYDQLGSFDRSHILRHLDARLEPFIVERQVEVCTLPQILARNNIADFHLLHIDVEGHDLEVLRSADLSRHAPIAVFIEHKHLSAPRRAEMRSLLRTSGYSIRDCGGDYFALHSAQYRRLVRAAG